MGQVERTSGGGSVTIKVTWERPLNFDQFDIDCYDINVSSTSGIENMTTACGECTNTTFIVSENPSKVQINTTFTITITARTRCNETGPTDTVSYTLSKFSVVLVATCCYIGSKYQVGMCLFSLLCDTRHPMYTCTGDKKSMHGSHICQFP